MKVLWVVNHHMAELANEIGLKPPVSGSWLVEMSASLSSIENIELNIVCPTKKKDKKRYIKGINYYQLEMSNYDRYKAPSKKMMEQTSSLIEELNPDIIHLQGSEFAYNLAFLKQKKVPVVISIQGLISEIVKNDNDWGGINYKGLANYFSLNNLMIYLPLRLKKFRNKLRANAEIKQLQQCNYRIGRTNWDKIHSYFYNPQGQYYYLQETIRKSFLYQKWEIEEASKFTVFCAGGYSSPLKGAHKTFEAIALLKKEFPKIQVRVVGRDPRELKYNYGYTKYIVNCIKKLKLDDNIVFTGILSDSQMAEEFSKAHVYVIGSSIENSSNTMGEAMCVGTPGVIANVGGLPSLADDEKEVLFYRFGDVEQMAWQIRRIFRNVSLASKLSKNSKKRAEAQYSNKNITTKLIGIYNDVIESSKKNKISDKKGNEDVKR
ncbi:glycosyltransferase family 4 protein [Desemzia sp. FAM 23991]|uniref:glycosyltransferase family 4 protein n=1 Tax=unclassified Desemzia TaxID=2685243 RepID=UPI003888F8B8